MVFSKNPGSKEGHPYHRGGQKHHPAFIENKLKFSSYNQDAVVIGEGRKFLVALILIDETMSQICPGQPRALYHLCGSDSQS